MPLPPFPIPLSVFRAGMALRRRILDLADLILPAEGAMWDFAAGMQRTKLAGALVNTGLADALGERGRDPERVAVELGLDPEVTGRVLRAAAASRLTHIDREGRVRLSRLGAPLRADHPRSIASWVAYQAAHTNALSYAQLEALLRGGAEPSGHRRAFGDSIWHYFAEHPQEARRFANAMCELTAIDAVALARAYPWPRRGVICDVAGGIGTLLAAILDRRAGATGILIEAPEVLAEAERFVHSRGMAGRIECRPGDVFGDFAARADVYVMKWILHDWSDDACAAILSRIRAMMPVGARVLTIDLHLAARRPDAITAISDLHMLVECEGGRERSPAEVRSLMRDVGLEPRRVRHAGMHMLIEGVRR